MHATFAGHVLLREPTPSAPATVGATPTAASDNVDVVEDDRDSKWEDIEDDDVNPLDIEAELDEGDDMDFGVAKFESTKSGAQMKLVEAVQGRIRLIDELQILILENHDVRLYPPWSNTSENLPTHPNVPALLPLRQRAHWSRQQHYLGGDFQFY